MSLTATPYGLRYYSEGGLSPSAGGTVREFKQSTNRSTGTFFGDLVNLTSGDTLPVTATPVGGTIDSKTPIGVCVGVRYVDPVLKQVQHSMFLPANAVNAGYTSIWIKVIDNPFALWVVQADGAVANAKIGLNAPLGNFSAGSTTTGVSGVNLASASIAATNTLAVRIVDLVNNISITGGDLSTPGDAFTDVIVRFNFQVHAYSQATGQ